MFVHSMDHGPGKTSWARCFQQGLTGEGGAPASAPEVEALIHRLATEADQRWPGLQPGLSGFLPALARRLPEGQDPTCWLESLHFADLYLAFHCASGDGTAVAAFETTHFPLVERALARAGTPPELRDEIKQLLRERMLVGREGPDGPGPAIARYAGRGSLAGWVRVSAMREVYRFSEQQRRWTGLEEERLAGAAVGDAGDPEAAYLKGHYRAEFKRAFSVAMASLTPRRRNILRHYYLDGLSIDRIGALYRIHRATAARELHRIRAALLEQTRAAMMSRLQVSQEECESIIRLIESRLEVSIFASLDESEKK